LLVETDSLSKSYGDFRALDACSLGVRRGEVFGLLGPNGAGKTTLLRLLLGYLQPTAGRAAIDGLDCQQQSVAVRRLVSYLPGEARLYRGLRGRDVLRFFAEIRPGSNWKGYLQKADELELDLSRRVAFMSTGMRQKLALAIALAAETPVMILDEPTANLDPSVRARVLAFVAAARKAGRTVIFSSHVLSEVEEVCDRVAILRGGCLVHTQVIGELHRSHRLRAVLAGPLPPVPPELEDRLSVQPVVGGGVEMEADELPPLLGWLASAPISEIRVEPIGLRAIYERFHGGRDEPT